MLKAVFFDLDGTLLPMDQDEFMKAYFGSLAKRLSKIGYEPDRLISSIWSGSAAMVKNDGSKTNEDAFWEAFNASYGKDGRADERYFYEYYVEDFDKVSAICKKNPGAALAVADIKALGLRVALATNPLFPSIATEKRIAWAGLDKSDFELFTTYENSRYCKPNLKYYEDILAKLNLAPEEVLMVGNDVSEDMVCEELGCNVFLVTDCLINKQGKKIIDYPNGDLSDLIQHVITLI